MKIDTAKLSRKIAEGLIESVDSLRSSELDIVSRVGELSTVARMIEDPNRTECSARLINCSLFGSDDVYDRVVLDHFKRDDLFAIFEARDSEKWSTFESKIIQIDESIIEVEVKEVFSVSATKGYGKVYNNGERVDFRNLQPRELIDWLLKILQCSTASELFDRLDNNIYRYMILGSKDEKIDLLLNKDRSLKEEFRNVDVYELLDKHADFDDIARRLMSYLIVEKWPFDSIKRGWTKTYKFQVDFSDTIISIDEDVLKRKAIVKDRVLTALKEHCPFKSNFEKFHSPVVENTYEMIALDIKDSDSYLDFNQSQFDEETFVNALEYKVGNDLESLITDYVLDINLDVNNNRRDSENCSIVCRVFVKGKYLDNSVIDVDDRHVPIDQYLSSLAEDRSLDLEENYDILKEEILENFEAEDHFYEIIYIKFELSFSDLFED